MSLSSTVKIAPHARYLYPVTANDNIDTTTDKGKETGKNELMSMTFELGKLRHGGNNPRRLFLDMEIELSEHTESLSPREVYNVIDRITVYSLSSADPSSVDDDPSNRLLGCLASSGLIPVDASPASASAETDSRKCSTVIEKYDGATMYMLYQVGIGDSSPVIRPARPEKPRTRVLVPIEMSGKALELAGQEVCVDVLLNVSANKMTTKSISSITKCSMMYDETVIDKLGNAGDKKSKFVIQQRIPVDESQCERDIDLNPFRDLVSHALLIRVTKDDTDDNRYSDNLQEISLQHARQDIQICPFLAKNYYPRMLSRRADRETYDDIYAIPFSREGAQLCSENLSRLRLRFETPGDYSVNIVSLSDPIFKSSSNSEKITAILDLGNVDENRDDMMSPVKRSSAASPSCDEAANGSAGSSTNSSPGRVLWYLVKCLGAIFVYFYMQALIEGEGAGPDMLRLAVAVWLLWVVSSASMN